MNKSNRRSVTSRNLFGSALGGLLGILFVGFIHWALLPVGCFTGVIIGWFFQEIHEWSVNFLGAMSVQWKMVRSRLSRPIPVLRLPRIRWKSQMVLACLKAAGIVWVWLISRPSALKIWLKQALHRMVVLRIATSIAHGIIVALAFLIIANSLPAKEKGSLAESIFGGSLMAGFVLILLVPTLLYGSLEGSRIQMAKRGVTAVKRFLSSPILFFGYELLLMIVLSGIGYLLFMFTVPIILLSIPAVFGMLLFPILFCGCTLQGVYKLSVKRPHLLCLSTTLVVTTISAAVMYSYFGNPIVVWMTALVTGILSAISTELARKCLHVAVRRSPLLKSMLCLDPFVQFDYVAQYLWKGLVARLSRTYNAIPRNLRCAFIR